LRNKQRIFKDERCQTVREEEKEKKTNKQLTDQWTKRKKSNET
jgi:hypothetical protein